MLDILSEKADTQKQERGCSTIPQQPMPSYKGLSMAAPAVSYAPDLGAIELVILDQIKDPENMVSVVEIRQEINTFEPWQEMKPNKVHYWVDKLVERGLVRKSKESKRSRGIAITEAGIAARLKAGEFFRQFTA